MKKVDLIQLFYKCIIPEAARGKIKVFFNYSVAFSTKLREYNKICKSKIENNELMIPTLIIDDMASFNDLLCEYVDKALMFYDDTNFPQELLDMKYFDNKDMICKEKEILVHLMANATYEDFTNPINFLNNRINFIDNHENKNYDIGYYDFFDSYVNVKIDKDTINNETPSQFIVELNDNSNNKFIFPKVKFGISNDKVYIYAIQNDFNEKNDLSKKINRKLYKVGEGLVPDDSLENVKDVTASFLVVLNMAINYFMALGYTDIVIPSILPIRYNSKQIILEDKLKRGKLDDKMAFDFSTKQDEIQNNLTNKLIRTFLRLACHYNNIEVTSFPYELDSCLQMKLHIDEDITCNNKLLYETGRLIYDNILLNNKKR